MYQFGFLFIVIAIIILIAGAVRAHETQEEEGFFLGVGVVLFFYILVLNGFAQFDKVEGIDQARHDARKAKEICETSIPRDQVCKIVITAIPVSK